MASSERMAGAILGQIVPLILIVMTITGAIYPAIDLTRASANGAHSRR